MEYIVKLPKPVGILVLILVALIGRGIALFIVLGTVVVITIAIASLFGIDLLELVL